MRQGRGGMLRCNKAELARYPHQRFVCCNICKKSDERDVANMNQYLAGVQVAKKPNDEVLVGRGVSTHVDDEHGG